MCIASKAEIPAIPRKRSDKITVAFGQKTVTVKVLDIRETTKKTESVGMYEVISETDA